MLDKIVIIIPLYNEKLEVFMQVLNELGKCNYQIIIVDDGSKSIYETKCKGIVRYEKNVINRGQGYSLRRGMEIALELGYEYCVHFDADGQHSIHDVQSAYETMLEKSVDVVLGSRFIGSARDNNNINGWRFLVLKGGIGLNWLLSGIKLSDSNNGFRICNIKAMKSLTFKANRMAHASEINWLIRWRKLTFIEFPVNIVYTEYTKAKGQKMFDSLTVIKEVFSVYFKHYFMNKGKYFER